MENNKLHIEADLYLLGYTFPAVHSLLDASVKYFGPAHRLDQHDYQTILLIDNLWGKKAGDIALLHILLDFHILNDKLVIKIIKEKKHLKN